MWGLALEGGGTKGAYHIGVLKAITELGINVTCVVGASIGAVNGALFAQGELDTLAKFWENITADDIITLPVDMTQNIFDFKNISVFLDEVRKHKGLDITPFENLLKSLVNEDKLRRGTIDFGLVTWRVTGNEGEHLFLADIPWGMLCDYIIASCCLPVFKARNINDSVYLDGGLVNNLPVNMLVEKGIKNIISVEVGGIGIRKKISAAGCNVINIRCNDSVIGLLDFEKDKILEAQKLGYFDAMKAFGKCCGVRYYFDAEDYYASKLKYGENVISGLEKAAQIFGIDRMKIYKLKDLIKLVVESYLKTPKRDDIMQILKWTDSEKTAGLAAAICAGEYELLGSKAVADFLGEIFDAASAVAYFSMQNIQ